MQQEEMVGGILPAVVANVPDKPSIVVRSEDKDNAFLAVNVPAVWTLRSDLQLAPPFVGTFPVSQTLVDDIAAAIRKDGYDQRFPLVAWRIPSGKLLLVDGHVRLLAAAAAGLDGIPVCEPGFKTEGEAVLYSYRANVPRRHLRPGELLKYVAEVDRRLASGTRTDLAPPGARSGKSAAATAKILGTSTRTVERLLCINAKSSSELKAAVNAETVSVTKAAELAEAGSKPEASQEELEIAAVERAFNVVLSRLTLPLVAVLTEKLYRHMVTIPAIAKTPPSWTTKYFFPVSAVSPAEVKVEQ